MDGLDRHLHAAAALAHPLRCALYRYVRAAEGPVGRDEAARAVGVSRDRAAAQLDRLASAGLVDVSFGRLGGRSGPGAGRPSKLYRPSSLEIDVSIPPRRSDVAALVLAAAVIDADVPPEHVDRAAHDLGREIGGEARSGLGTGPSRARAAAAIEDVAQRYGFEPVRVEQTIALANCPFRSLVQRRGQIVCRMNLSLFRGVIAGLEADAVEARPVQGPRGCCVIVEVSQD